MELWLVRAVRDMVDGDGGGGGGGGGGSKCEG